MAEHSSIEWTDATWNPITGCSVVSPGCTNCYAMKLAGTRLRHLPSRKGLTVETKAGPVWNGKVRLIEEKLAEPLRWRRGRRIFVCAHGDLFHESVPDEWIDRVFAVMALSPHHTFQVLTKRPTRMREWFEERWQPTPAQRIEFPGLAPMDVPAQAEGDDRHERVFQAAGEFLDLDTVSDRFWNPDGSRKWPGWPLPNVWLGVSAEDQQRADERVTDLLATPAAVRFVSAEPLLGPINFASLTVDENYTLDALRGLYEGATPAAAPYFPENALDWIIAGGESGSGARPMHPAWVRQIRDACAEAGVAFHFKQWGSWKVELDREAEDPDWRADYSSRLNDREPNIAWLNVKGGRGFHGAGFHVMRRVTKGAAGRLLDGVEHNGFPEARP